MSPSSFSALHPVVGPAKFHLHVYSCHRKYHTCWHVECVHRGVKELRNVGIFLCFKCHSYFGAFSPDFTSCWPCADTRSIGGAIFDTETAAAGSLSLLGPLKAQKVLCHQQCQDKAGCCTPQVQDALPPYKHMRRLWKKFLPNLSVSP